jgi:hypothetical protein
MVQKSEIRENYFESFFGFLDLALANRSPLDFVLEQIFLFSSNVVPVVDIVLNDLICICLFLLVFDHSEILSVLIGDYDLLFSFEDLFNVGKLKGKSDFKILSLFNQVFLHVDYVGDNSLKLGLFALQFENPHFAVVSSCAKEFLRDDSSEGFGLQIELQNLILF